MEFLNQYFSCFLNSSSTFLSKMLKAISWKVFGILPLILFSAFILGKGSVSLESSKILFVSDRDEKANWDIYMTDSNATKIDRLTLSDSIENHPNLSHDGAEVVFSSDRTGNFEIYRASLSTLGDTSTWVQLTNYGCNSSTVECTPARHPHWSLDGSRIIYTTKDGCRETTKEVVSQCSVPIKIKDPCGEKYERIHVINRDGTKDIVVDVQSMDSRIVHAGHPSFSPDGSKIVFSGAINQDATDWEVFTVDWDGSTPGNIRQVTSGSSYPPNPNPIQMSGGAEFNLDGSKICFNSTRTAKGNSQIFCLPSDSVNTPVSDSYRITYSCANDYVPEFLEDGKIVFTSDSSDTAPEWDLDIFVMDLDRSGRRNLTNNINASEMLLIADEVSWFCGLPPNLSPCTFIPRAVSVESKYYMFNSRELLPDGFPNRDLYPTYMGALGEYLVSNYPDYLEQINGLLSKYQRNPKDLSTATKQIVLPSLMPPTSACSDCVEITTTSLPDSTVGTPYSASLQANRDVNWKIIAGSLPPGLELNSETGSISGTPSGGSKYSFTVVAEETNGNADSKDLAITIQAVAPITIYINQSNFTAGDTLTLSISINNPGDKIVVDIFVGFLLPGGSLYFFDSSLVNLIPSNPADPTTFTPARTSLTLPSGFSLDRTDFFSIPLPPSLPPGTYATFAALAEPGSAQAGSIKLIGDVSLAYFTVK